jgi:tetratricopeptide (TPR) repeat protein
MFRGGQYAECIQACEQAIRENDFSENFRLLKLRAEMETGRYAQALQTLEAALGRFPSSVQLRWAGREVYRFNGQSERAKKLEVEITQLLQQAPWRYSDAVNQVVAGRFYLSQGVDPKRVLDTVYHVVKQRQPSYTEVYLASGELALDKHDYALAAQAFAQAVALDAGDPEGHFGLARAYAPSDEEKAAAALKAALERNPRHIGSLLMLAEDHIDSERYAEAEAVLAEVAKVNPHEPRAAALRAVLAHLRNQPDSEKFHRQAGLKHWADNPAVDHLIGRKLSQKYRFAEGAAYQRAALTIDPQYVPAKLQLAQDLLRLGQEEEGWKLAAEVAQADGYNVVAYNLITLQEQIAKYRTLEGDGLIVRMEAREAEVYGRRVLELLQRARRTLCAKYEVTLEEPILVELFPRQQDFAVRTFGLPGGAGFLGVCFGNVITANSPASQAAHPSSWEATLWHEMCHVVTLHKTHNKMPRWLSEGISVYEERQADPRWGQAITPATRAWLLEDTLTPVSQLSAAFLHAPSPAHLQFAYLESSLVVEFFIERYGLDTLRRVLVDLGVGMPIQEALARYVGSTEALDAQFAAYARTRAQQLAPEVDWSPPELPRQASTEAVAAFVRQHPHNYEALRRLARLQLQQRAYDDAEATLQTMLRLYPQDASAEGPYALAASLHRALGNAAQERQVLAAWAELTADQVDVLSRLAELALEAQDWELARRTAERWLGVQPLAPAPHRAAARAAAALGDAQLAIDSYRALLLLDPLDPADLHYQLATWLFRQGDHAAARRHALLALEQTPRFRAAHRQLLEIVRGRPSSPPKRPGEP